MTTTSRTRSNLSRFLDVYQEAMDLYGMIHSRFIQSPKGLAMMREKFLTGAFGVCPRVLCGGQYVLPIGMSENLQHSRVKVFCPKCEDVYIPKKKCSDVEVAEPRDPTSLGVV